MQELSMSMRIANELTSTIVNDVASFDSRRLPNEKDLCNMFSVSRQVIREALKILEARGVINIVHGSGCYISNSPGIIDDPLGLQFMNIENKRKILNDWYLTRRNLETYIVRLVVQNATDEEIEKIINKQMAVESQIKLGKKVFLKTDREFHIELAKASHNIIVERTTICLQQSFYYNVVNSDEVVYGEQVFQNALIHHKRIVDSIVNRDEDGAVFAMRSHMTQAMKDIKI